MKSMFTPDLCSRSQPILCSVSVSVLSVLMPVTGAGASLRALSERSRSQLRGRSQSPSHQSVSSGQWRGWCDIMSVTWRLFICVENHQSLLAVTTSWLKILVSLTPYGKLYAKSDLDSLRICLFWVENKNQKVAYLYLEWDTELEILDLAPEIGFLRFMVSV